MWRTLSWLSFAGAAGTLARFGVASCFARWGGQGFPWATFAVNALGCFLFGLVVVLAEERGLLNPEVRLVLLTGFMGAFTTFSTFSFDTAQFIRKGEWLLAMVNVALQNVLGVALVFLGASLGRMV